jgi:hypothetical protein
LTISYAPCSLIAMSLHLINDLSRDLATNFLHPYKRGKLVEGICP